MFISKKNRLAVYHNLFREGVLVAKKDFYGVWTYKSKDGDKDFSLPNLEVMGLLKSLKSRGYVKETFNWQYYYWYLTEEGINYLREYLSLPKDVAPQTHMKREARPARPGPPGGGDRQFEKEKRLGPDGAFEPSYVSVIRVEMPYVTARTEGGGFGRGRGDAYRS